MIDHNTTFSIARAGKYTVMAAGNALLTISSKPNYNVIFNNDAGQIGELDFNGPEMKFTGNAEESAKLFFDWVAKNYAERLVAERAPLEAQLKAEREARANADRVATEFQQRFLDERKALEGADKRIIRYAISIDTLMQRAEAAEHEPNVAAPQALRNTTGQAETPPTTPAPAAVTNICGAPSPEGLLCRGSWPHSGLHSWEDTAAPSSKMNGKESTRERFIRELDRDFPKTTPSQPIASAARAEGVLEGLEEAAQLASKSLFGQNASDVIRAEIDRRKAEGEGGQNVALDG